VTRVKAELRESKGIWVQFRVAGYVLPHFKSPKVNNGP
jgi:hypothetical protein